MEEAATGHVLFGLDALWVSTALLIATYATIMTEKLNRAIVALVGARLMISLGILNQEQRRRHARSGPGGAVGPRDPVGHHRQHPVSRHHDPVIQNMAPTFGGEQALLPLWWSLSLGACLGGNGTLIGASANLTIAGIGERAGVPFRFLEFAKVAFPLMLVSIVIGHAYLGWRFL